MQLAHVFRRFVQINARYVTIACKGRAYLVRSNTNYLRTKNKKNNKLWEVIMSKKEWTENGDYLDEAAKQREEIFNLEMTQTVLALKIGSR